MKQKFPKKLYCVMAIVTNMSYAEGGSWVSTSDINSITQVQNYISRTKLYETNPEELCIIYDLDNTILSAEPSIGGDSWMMWNNNLDASSRDKVTNWGLTNDAHSFEGALRFFIKYYPTEATTISIINNLKDKQQHPTIIMTARSYERYYAATENQLKANQLDFTSNPIGKSTSFSSDILLTPNHKRTAYKAYFNGVYYSADDNKGIEIINLIKQQRKITNMDKLCRTVVFVDNSQDNINNVYHALQGNKFGINLLALHYNRYDSYLIPSQQTINSWLIENSFSFGKQLHDLIDKLNY